MCLGVVLFGLILFGTLCFLDLDVCFLSRLEKFSAITSSSTFSAPFFSLFSFSNQYNVNVRMLMLSRKIFKCTQFLNYFLFFFSASIISITLSSILLIHSSIPSNLLLIYSSLFFNLDYCILQLCCLFISFNSLLNFFILNKLVYLYPLTLC